MDARAAEEGRFQSSGNLANRKAPQACQNRPPPRPTLPAPRYGQISQLTPHLQKGSSADGGTYPMVEAESETDFGGLKSGLPGPLAIHPEQQDDADAAIRLGAPRQC